MQVYYDRDADLGVLKGKGCPRLQSQGHAHANNLRDSGIDVVVGRNVSKSGKPECRLKVAETAELSLGYRYDVVARRTSRRAYEKR
jgi:ketol-acid reductoisomerase